MKTNSLSQNLEDSLRHLLSMSPANSETGASEISWMTPFSTSFFPDVMRSNSGLVPSWVSNNVSYVGSADSSLALSPFPNSAGIRLLNDFAAIASWSVIPTCCWFLINVTVLLSGASAAYTRSSKNRGCIARWATSTKASGDSSDPPNSTTQVLAACRSPSDTVESVMTFDLTAVSNVVT
jgi:hypothetical protein